MEDNRHPPSIPSAHQLLNNKQLFHDIWPTVFRYFDHIPLLTLRLVAKLWNHEIMTYLTQRKEIFNNLPSKVTKNNFILLNYDNLDRAKVLLSLLEHASSPMVPKYLLCSVNMDISLLIDGRHTVLREMLTNYGNAVQIIFFYGKLPISGQHVPDPAPEIDEAESSNKENSEDPMLYMVMRMFRSSCPPKSHFKDTAKIVKAVIPGLFEWCPNIKRFAVMFVKDYYSEKNFVLWEPTFSSQQLPLQPLKLQKVLVHLCEEDRIDAKVICDIIRRSPNLFSLHVAGNSDTTSRFVHNLLTLKTEPTVWKDLLQLQLPWNVVSNIDRHKLSVAFPNLQNLELRAEDESNFSVSDNQTAHQQYSFPNLATVEVNIPTINTLVTTDAFKRAVLASCTMFPNFGSLVIRAEMKRCMDLNFLDDEEVHISPPASLIPHEATFRSLTSLTLINWNDTESYTILREVVRAMRNLKKISLLFGTLSDDYSDDDADKSSESDLDYNEPSILNDKMLTRTIQSLYGLPALSYVLIENRWISNQQLYNAIKKVVNFPALSQLTIKSQKRKQDGMVIVCNLGTFGESSDSDTEPVDEDDCTEEDNWQYVIKTLNIIKEQERIQFKLIDFEFATDSKLQDIEGFNSIGNVRFASSTVKKTRRNVD